MSDKCLDCPVPSADMDGFIVSGPGGAPRSEGSGVSSPEGPFVREAPQTGHFILKGKVSSSSPLPDVPEPGWAYEAAEAGTYGGVHATPGDLIWCAGVNPVRWRVAQSDFDGAVRSVSVQQVLSSGTKIATVTVDGQATDLFCETGGGIQTLSGGFGCETREVSPAVDEPAVLDTTRAVFLDQAGYEALEAGNRPSGHYEYAVTNGRLSHDSSSFTTLVPSGIQNPYAIALSTGTDQYASGYVLAAATIMDWPYYGAVKISDLLAAGESGVKLAFLGGDAEPYGDGTLDVYVSFSSLAEDPTNPPPYVVSYSARKDAVTEDVLTAKIDGKDGSGAVVSSVDVSPLLNYIGGRIEEVPAGDLEMLPLVDYQNPDVEPPFYFALNFGFFISGNAVSPDAVAVSNGVQIVSFSASASEPDSFAPAIYYGTPPPGMPIFTYAKVDSSTGMPAQFTFETALAGPIVLDELDISSGQPVPTGNTVSLVTERLEGDVPAYSFTFYSGSGEMKKVLRLYPSCDGDIDLSGLGGGGGTSAETLSFECGASASPVAVASDISASMFAYPSPKTPPFSGDYPLTTDGNTFTIKGSEFNTYASRAGSTGSFHLTVEDGGEGYYFITPCDVMAYFFSGAHGIGVGTVRQFIGSSRGFLLESRTELTSEDPGGPDIVCVFRFVECGGDRLTLGDQIVNLSCIAEHAGPGDYSQAYSRTISSGDAAPYELDLSSVVNDADGFYDVFVIVRVSNYTSISVRSDRFTTVTLDCSAVSSGSPVLGVVRFWCDGGCRRYSYGTVSSPSVYNVYGISMTEVSLLNYSSPMSRYSSSKITISPPSGSTFSSTVTVKVYVRQPHSAV